MDPSETSFGYATPDRLRSQWRAFPSWIRRAVIVIVGVVAFILVLSLVYHAVMITFEGRSPRFAHTLQVVVETFTGTGYGSDSPWETPVANLVVTVMDLSTFLVLFVVIPYLFQPVLENAFTPSVPTVVDEDDHVVVCGTPNLTSQLVEELTARDVTVVIIAEDETDALALQDDGLASVHGEPTSVDALRRAGADRARAVVVDTADERAASAVLAAGEVAPAVRTIAVVPHLDHELQLRHAGADRIITPRDLLGRRLAERVHCLLDPARTDTVPVGADISLLELTVGTNEALAGTSVGDLTAMADVSVVGMWADGEFVTSLPDDTTIPENVVLLLSGPDESLAELETGTFRSTGVEPTVLVAGHGVVGSTVRRELDRSHVDCRVIDTSPGDDVDVVGDATALETLDRAGLADADVLVVALPDDDLTVLSVLATDESPQNPAVITRLNVVENETKLRRAGADYVLSVPTITGRLLVSDVLGEGVLGFDHQIRTARIDGAKFAGRALEDTAIAESGCVVVGVERDGTFRTDPPATFEIRRDDLLVVVGNDAEVGQL